MACNGQEEEFEREPARPVQRFTVISSFSVSLTSFMHKHKDERGVRRSSRAADYR